MAPDKPPRKGRAVLKKVPAPSKRAEEIAYRKEMMDDKLPSATPRAARHKARASGEEEAPPQKRLKVANTNDDNSKDRESRHAASSRGGDKDGIPQAKKLDASADTTSDEYSRVSEDQHSNKSSDRVKARAQPDTAGKSEQSLRKTEQQQVDHQSRHLAPPTDKAPEKTVATTDQIDSDAQLALTKPSDVEPPLASSKAAERKLLVKIIECIEVDALVTRGVVLTRKVRDRLDEAREGPKKAAISIVLANWVAFTEIAKSNKNARLYDTDDSSPDGSLLVYQALCFSSAYEALFEVKKSVAVMADLTDLEEKTAELLDFISERIDKQSETKKRTTSQKVNLRIDGVVREGVLFLSELAKEQKAVLAHAAVKVDAEEIDAEDGEPAVRETVASQTEGQKE